MQSHMTLQEEGRSDTKWWGGGDVKWSRDFKTSAVLNWNEQPQAQGPWQPPQAGREKARIHPPELPEAARPYGHPNFRPAILISNSGLQHGKTINCQICGSLLQ